MIPTIHWAQTPEHILIKILISNVKDLNLNFNNNMLFVKGISSNIEYNLNVKLYNEIDSDMSHHIYKIYDGYIDCKLQKKNNENWDYLIVDQYLYKSHIKMDWLRWIDKDLEDNDDLDENNFEQLIDSMKMNLNNNCSNNNCTNTKCNDNNCLENLNGIRSGESTPCSSDEEILE